MYDRVNLCSLFSKWMAEWVLVYLNLYLIMEFQGIVLQMSSQRNTGLHHHPQSSAAFTPAKHTHGKVVLSTELYRRLQERSQTLLKLKHKFCQTLGWRVTTEISKCKLRPATCSRLCVMCFIELHVFLCSSKNSPLLLQQPQMFV